jgi:hypothetical protein
MNNRFHLEALDTCLQMICRSTLVFGGKPMLLAGYFRQVLPVVKRGSREQNCECSFYIIMGKLKITFKFPCK